MPSNACRFAMDLATADRWYSHLVSGWALLDAGGTRRLAADVGASATTIAAAAAAAATAAGTAKPACSLPGGSKDVLAVNALSREVEAWRAIVAAADSFMRGVLAVERTPLVAISGDNCNCGGCGKTLGRAHPPPAWTAANPLPVPLPHCTSVCWMDTSMLSVWLPGPIAPTPSDTATS
jgi:hypothetical protein